ncbi:MAG: FAD-dependent oxidoreductase [Planctomycetes bacterium]|nr:FAD-dependent oxidoreductase [Planctomycetota bacterium]
METFTENSRELPVRNFDVVIAGAGTAGSIAAIAAAREGARTLVVESKGYPGGIAVEGGTALHSFYNLWTISPDAEKKQVVRGIPQEIIDRLASEGGTSGHAPMDYGTDYDAVCTAIDVEIYKRVVFEMMVEAGAEVAMNTLLVGAVREGRDLSGVILESRSGREVAQARCFVDATGYGDLAAHAGASYSEPNDYPVANSIGVGGVDIEKYSAFFEDKGALVQRAHGTRNGIENRIVRVQGRFEDLSSDFAKKARAIGMSPVITSVRDNYFMFLKLNYKMESSPTDRDAVTEAELELRRRQAAAVELLREYVPGCEDAFIARSSPSLCIRRGRCIECDYDLSLEDILDAHRFDDEVFLYGFHDSAPRLQIRNGKWYGFPFRALCVKDFNNLLAAGMLVTSDHDAHMSTRNTVSCMCMGQAAGTAAALAAGNNCGVRELRYAELRQVLLEQNVYLED